MRSAGASRRMASCDCHAVLDLEGRFVAANDDLAGCLDASMDALLGEDLERFIDAEVPRAVLDDLWRELSAGKSWSAALPLRSMGGAAHWVTLTAVPDMRRGVAKSYLVQIRPAFCAEIEHARAMHARVAHGVEFEGGQTRTSGPLAGSGLGAAEHPERLAGLAALVVLFALVVLVTLAVWPELGAWPLRALMAGLACLLALGGIGVIVLAHRHRRREYQLVCGLIDRIAEGDTDAGGLAVKRVSLGGLRDALRRLQLKLSIAAHGGGARKSGAEQAEEAAKSLALLAARLRAVEERCAEIVDMPHRFASPGTESGSAEVSIMKRLATLSEGLAALQSSVLSQAQTSRKSRVLGLNLGLLEGRSDIEGIGNLRRTALAVARESADGLQSMEQEADRLRQELGALIAAMPTLEKQSGSIPVAVKDALAGLLEELRALRSLVDADRLVLRPVSDITCQARESAYSRMPLHDRVSDGQQVKKMSRLKTVSATPVPRVGRGKRGGPLEEDWHD